MVLPKLDVPLFKRVGLKTIKDVIGWIKKIDPQKQKLRSTVYFCHKAAVHIFADIVIPSFGYKCKTFPVMLDR